MAAFVVAGSLSGYTVAPTLNYQDVSGNWVPLPAGAQVSVSGFQFTHDDITVPGSYTISVRDANAPTIQGTSTAFLVSLAPSHVTIGAIADSFAGVAFQVSGSLLSYVTAPSLDYVDDAGTNWLPLPVGSSVTTTTYSFQHPGMAAGGHTVSVRDRNANTQFATSAAFTVSAGTGRSISLLQIADHFDTIGFNVAGTLNNYPIAASLQYQDDFGAPTGGEPMQRLARWSFTLNTDMTFSSDGLSATYNIHSSNAGTAGTLSNVSILPGQKVYWEFNLVAGDASRIVIGAGLQAALSYWLAQPGNPLFTPDLTGFFAIINTIFGGGLAVHNNTAVDYEPGQATLPLFVAPSDPIGFAVDRVLNKVWWRNGYGVWNYRDGDDPVTGTGGYDISWLGTSPMYPALLGMGAGSPTSLTVNPTLVINGGSSLFSQQTPKGFDALNFLASPWQSVASGSVSTGGFNFFHPSMPRFGPHTISLRDAGTPSITVDSNVFATDNLRNLNIFISPPGPESQGTSFTVSGIVQNYPVVPTLKWTNNPSWVAYNEPASGDLLQRPDSTHGTWTPVSQVTLTSFAFSHPGFTSFGGAAVVGVLDFDHDDHVASPYNFGTILMNVLGATADGAPV